MIGIAFGRWSRNSTSFLLLDRIYSSEGGWTPFVRISRRYGSFKEAFWIWLAWLLPHELVKWCAIRVTAHATTGPWGDQIVPDLGAMEATERWERGAAPKEELRMAELLEEHRARIIPPGHSY